ncbi:hypothetical protein BU667_11265 [Staphylococcus chromogenes]|nr:hypothetical protein BU658_08555 [Staphylococcus chromogenes]PTG77428.1 hypothetical protein BU667_11265 [Staphylococcus chromogenes]
MSISFRVARVIIIGGISLTQRNEFTKRLFASIPIKEGMRVLDLGCATGEVTNIVADMVGDEGEDFGIDINENMIQTAIDNKTKANTQFIQSDIYNLPEDIGKFDVIVGRRILMYLPDVMDCLNKVKSYMKPQGSLCFQESDAINGSTIIKIYLTKFGIRGLVPKDNQLNFFLILKKKTILSNLILITFLNISSYKVLAYLNC